MALIINIAQAATPAAAGVTVSEEQDAFVALPLAITRSASFINECFLEQHEHVTGNAVAFSRVAHLRGFPDTPQRDSHFSEGYDRFLELLLRERCPSRHLSIFYLCFSFSLMYSVFSKQMCVHAHITNFLPLLDL